MSRQICITHVPKLFFLLAFSLMSACTGQTSSGDKAGNSKSPAATENLDAIPNYLGSCRNNGSQIFGSQTIATNECQEIYNDKLAGRTAESEQSTCKNTYMGTWDTTKCDRTGRFACVCNINTSPVYSVSWYQIDPAKSKAESYARCSSAASTLKCHVVDPGATASTTTPNNNSNAEYTFNLLEYSNINAANATLKKKLYLAVYPDATKKITIGTSYNIDHDRNISKAPFAYGSYNNGMGTADSKLKSGFVKFISSTESTNGAYEFNYEVTADDGQVFKGSVKSTYKSVVR
jgi:hypothetical protein